LQRLSELDFNSGGKAGFAQSNIQYNYDAGDRLTNLADAGGANPNTQTITYDLLDNVTSATAREGTVNYTYNWVIPASMTPAGQPRANYTFDANNRLTRVAQASPGTLAASVPTYDNADRPTCVQLPNGVFASYGYDKDCALLQLLTATMPPEAARARPPT
jgi:hypothetical protein